MAYEYANIGTDAIPGGGHAADDAIDASVQALIKGRFHPKFFWAMGKTASTQYLKVWDDLAPTISVTAPEIILPLVVSGSAATLSHRVDQTFCKQKD